MFLLYSGDCITVVEEEVSMMEEANLVDEDPMEVKMVNVNSSKEMRNSYTEFEVDKAVFSIVQS